MKKYKYGITGILLLFCYFFMAPTTKAENNLCSASYVESTYMDKITYEKNGNIASFKGAKGLSYQTSADATRKYPDEAGNFEVAIPEGDQLEVYFYLAANDGKCEENHLIGSNTVFADASSKNNLYDGICASYRSKWSNNATMKAAVPYCFSEVTSYQYDEQTVRGWIQTAEALYESTINKQSTITKDSSNVDNVNVGRLVCDYYSDGNKKTYSHTEDVTDSTSSCRQICKETVTVEFSSPVATQSGMCFQYLVKLDSKLECEHVYTAPLPTRPSVCVANAACQTAYGISENGGPTEDFDACVLECDNGKYSQACINQCYQKVYGTSNNARDDIITNRGLFQNGNTVFSKANFMANESCLTPESVDPNNANQIQALYLQHQRDPGGRYVTDSSGKTHWQKASSGCASTLGQYYFTSVTSTRNTVLKVHGIWNNGLGTARYCSNDNDGFLRLCSLNGRYYSCTENCWWQNQCASDSVSSETVAQATYEQALKNYYAAKANCENKAPTCSNKTATYKMSVDNEGKTTTYQATQRQNSSNISGDDLVKSSSGYCLGSDTSSRNNGSYYSLQLNFPKQYIHNKTGEVTTSVTSNNLPFYTAVGDKFCTKLTSKNINSSWYDWKVNQNSKSLTASEKQAITDTIQNNITTSVSDFGYFGWNFDISCFYALIKNPGKDNPKDGDNPSNVTNDFIFRTISLNDVFPASKNALNGRDPRFNWSCAATNLTNKNYPVQPIALTKKIENRGEKIYNESNSSEYLDYEIILTPSTIQKIRNEYNSRYQNYSYVKEDQNNDIAVSTSSRVAGVTVYNSSFLHRFLGSDVVKKSGLIGCNNQSSATTCDNAIDTDNACYNEYMAQSVK